MSKREEIWTVAPKQKHIERARLKARVSVNKHFHSSGDKRPRNERYNGGSKLGVKVFGGAASTDEYRDGYARIFGK